MDKATAGGHRVSRLLSRALLVLGGVTAATAAAWLISSATASADTLPSVVSPGQAVVTGSGLADLTNKASGAQSASKPFGTGLSSAVSSVSDPVADAGSTALNAANVVTEPSRHVVLPLAADLPATPAGLDQLTTGLRGAVGQLGDRIPVDTALPAQLVGHLGRGAVSTPAVPATPAQPSTTGRYRTGTQSFPVAARQHGKPGIDASSVVGQHHPVGSLPLAPSTPGSSPFGPLTFPAVPGSGGGSGNGFAASAGLGLVAGSGSPISPELHVVDVLSPAVEPASVMPGKQPGVTPD